MMDGYYFDDKIPDYGNIGKNLDKAEKQLKVKILKNKNILHEEKKKVFNDLEQREKEREAAAEEWLKSALDSWEIAAQIGRNVIIIATSTGAPISVWLASELNRAKKTRGLIFVSPNFKIRLPLGFLLFL